MFMYYCQSDEVIFQLTESRPVIKVFHSRFLTRYKWLCYFLLYKMYYNTLCHVYYMDESITRESKSVTQDLLTPRINQIFFINHSVELVICWNQLNQQIHLELSTAIPVRYSTPRQYPT